MVHRAAREQEAEYGRGSDPHNFEGTQGFGLRRSKSTLRNEAQYHSSPNRSSLLVASDYLQANRRAQSARVARII